MVAEGLDLSARIFYQHIRVNSLVSIVLFNYSHIHNEVFSLGFFSQWFLLKILVFVFVFIFYYCVIDFKSNP